MKKRQIRTLALACLFALVLSIAAPAWAATAELESTRVFLDYLDSEDIRYTNEGMSDGSEVVRVASSMDHYPTLTCKLFFKDDCEEVSLRMWNIVTASAGKNYILSTLNTLNSDFKFAKFVLDESDSTVQAELDVYIDAAHCGRSVYDSLLALFTVVDRDEVAEKLHSLE